MGSSNIHSGFELQADQHIKVDPADGTFILGHEQTDITANTSGGLITEVLISSLGEIATYADGTEIHLTFGVDISGTADLKRWWWQADATATGPVYASRIGGHEYLAVTEGADIVEIVVRQIGSTLYWSQKYQGSGAVTTNVVTGTTTWDPTAALESLRVYVQTDNAADTVQLVNHSTKTIGHVPV